MDLSQHLVVGLANIVYVISSAIRLHQKTEFTIFSTQEIISHAVAKEGHLMMKMMPYGRRQLMPHLLHRCQSLYIAAKLKS